MHQLGHFFFVLDDENVCHAVILLLPGDSPVAYSITLGPWFPNWIAHGGRICESCRKGGDRSAGVSLAPPSPREDVGFCLPHGCHGPYGCLPTAGPIGPGAPVRPGEDQRAVPHPAEVTGVPARFGSVAGRGGSAREGQMT